MLKDALRTKASCSSIVPQRSCNYVSACTLQFKLRRILLVSSEKSWEHTLRLDGNGAFSGTTTGLKIVKLSWQILKMNERGESCLFFSSLLAFWKEVPAAARPKRKMKSISHTAAYEVNIHLITRWEKCPRSETYTHVPAMYMRSVPKS